MAIRPPDTLRCMTIIMVMDTNWTPIPKPIQNQWIHKQTKEKTDFESVIM